VRQGLKKIGILCALRWLVLYAGGNWDNGSNAGLFYFYGNNGSCSSGSNIGARHLFLSNSTRRVFHAAWRKFSRQDAA
jgi:hypothetical protein